MDGREIDKQLKKLRASRSELAQEMGVDPATVWRFLSGRRKRQDRPFIQAVELAMKNLEAKIRSDLSGPS